MSTKGSKIIKWVFDRTVSLIGIIGLSPFIAAIGVLIKIKMPDGPVFFCQRRVGQHGKLFVLLKFRTMHNLPEGNNVTILNDSRVTPFGSFLRKYKIDELPELWNVFIGDMSFVGPRPDVEGYADKLTGSDRKILDLKPGITGPATLKYRNEEEILSRQDDPLKYNDEVIWPDKVRINLQYLDNRSFWGDINLIIKTVFGRK